MDKNYFGVKERIWKEFFCLWYENDIVFICFLLPKYFRLNLWSEIGSYYVDGLWYQSEKKVLNKVMESERIVINVKWNRKRKKERMICEYVSVKSGDCDDGGWRRKIKKKERKKEKEKKYM